MAALIDQKPMAEGVVYPDRDHPIVPDGATCQEVTMMVGDRYVRCGQPAVMVVDHGGREIYWMCLACGTHNVRNRGGKMLAGPA